MTTKEVSAMVRANTASERFLDLFLKSLPIKPYTEYELSFDVLGAPVNVWLNPKHIETNGTNLSTSFCKEWQSVRLRFTTHLGTGSRGNWAFSFNKRLEGDPVTGRQESYIDNVRLVACNNPTVNLIENGDFEAPANDESYLRNWDTILFSESSRLYGVKITSDPLRPENHCLYLPSMINPPPYAESVTLRAEGFGFYKSPSSQTHFNEAYGTNHHQLLFVTHGQIDITDGDTMWSTGNETVLYIPPHTPLEYTLCQGEESTYHWVTFSGEPSEQFLEYCGLTSVQARPVLSAEKLSVYIENMLALSPADPFYAYGVSGYLQILLTDLKRQLLPHAFAHKPSAIVLAANRLREHPEVPVSNKELARTVGLSTGHFIRSFKQYIGLSPNQYRLRELMKKGENLLIRTPLTVQEVAYRLGLDDPYYFSRLFRSFYGVSPREYRKTHKE